MRIRLPSRRRRPGGGQGAPAGPAAGAVEAAGADLEELLLAVAEETPSGDTDVRDLRLLALDLETTGLNPRDDHVLSVGFVPVDGLAVTLSGAYHAVVRPPVAVGQSAAVHGLTDDALAAGSPLEDVLPAVLRAVRGRVLLAHFASIEVDFLRYAVRSSYGVNVPLAAVDTLELQRRLVATPYGDPPVGALRLGAARERLGLPRYHAHHALTDALGCAELYLALVAHLSGGRPMTLRTLRALQRRT